MEPMNSAFALAFTNASLGRISLKLLSEMSGGIIQCSGNGRSEIIMTQIMLIVDCVQYTRMGKVGLGFDLT